MHISLSPLSSLSPSLSLSLCRTSSAVWCGSASRAQLKSISPTTTMRKSAASPAPRVVSVTAKPFAAKSQGLIGSETAATCACKAALVCLCLCLCLDLYLYRSAPHNTRMSARSCVCVDALCGHLHMSLPVRVTAGYILVRDEARPSADECVRCPSGSYSTEKATYPTSAFVRDSSVVRSRCVDCNFLKSECAGGADVTPIAGFWRPPNQSSLVRRANGATGTLTTVELITCVPAERCLKGGKCVKGMHGPVCGLCDKNYAMGSKDLCIPCPESLSMALQIGGAVVVIFIFCVAYYLVLLRPLFSGDNKPGGKDKINREASALSYSGAGLWSWCMTQPCLKVVFKPFRILFKKMLEYLLFFIAGFLKNSGSEIVKVVISFMQVSGTFLSSYSIKVAQSSLAPS